LDPGRTVLHRRAFFQSLCGDRSVSAVCADRPEATYSVKGEGEKKKEHVGYKVQVAETVFQAKLEPGEPTQNFLAAL
jgi:hypothetical protein